MISFLNSAVARHGRLQVSRYIPAGNLRGLNAGGCSYEVPRNDLLTNAEHLVEHVSALYSDNQAEYWKVLDSQEHSDEIYSVIDDLINSNKQILRSIMPMYSTNYAERVFHDRQLCEHISKTLVSIGFDGTSDGGDPRQWIERQPWPAWAVEVVIARDRGKCAVCGVDITMELDADRQIDHIVPLAKAGTNDLVNLQLLCSTCNRDKSVSIVDVHSSIPEYLKHKRGRQKN